MASEKKDSGGIALLSIYGDDDDDMEELDNENQTNTDEIEPETQQNDAVPYPNDVVPQPDDEELEPAVNIEEEYEEDTPPILSGNSTPKQVSASSPPQPPPVFVQQTVSPAPPQVPVDSDSSRSRKGTLTIVDYGQDEVALSPEQEEEGEFVETGRVMFGSDLQAVSGTPTGTVQVLTPSTQATPQTSEKFYPLESEPVSHTVTELEPSDPKEDVQIHEGEHNDMDPLDKFLPPPPKTKCSEELQEKIVKFLLLKKKTGRSFNSEVRNRKEYRNPDFLLHAVTYQDIDQIGSCFSKDVFDPHGYDKSDYYDEIEADMKLEMERKEQEKKRNQRVEFQSSGTQTAPVVPTPKLIPTPVALSTVSSAGSHSSSAVDVAREGRQHKKSKWDKVDGDGRNPLPSSGHDSFSSVGAHAALLTAANAGSGYTAFAQQRRREAEEKRSSDKKFDRRS